MENSDDEIRPVANRELPVSETRDSAGAAAVVAAQIEIDRALALNTARDEKRRRRRGQDAAGRARLAQDPVAAAATRERDAAIQEMRRKRLRSADPEDSVSTQAADTAARAAARGRLQSESPAGSAKALARDSAPRAELRSRVAIDALSSVSEGFENDEEMAGVEGSYRPRGLCAAEIFSGGDGYDVEPSNFVDMDLVCQKCKAYHWMDERLKSSSDSRPVFSICCGNGSVHLPAFPDPPEPLREWELGETAQDRTMAKHFRLLKNAMALTSLQGQSPPPLPGGSGWEPAVRLHGKLTHYAGPLLTAEGRETSFLQAYFLDSEENGERLAAVCRAVAHGRGGQLGFGRIPVSELDTTSRGLFAAVQMLYGVLLRENNLVKQFFTARERVQEIEATTGRPVPSLRVVVHANAVPAGCHVRVYSDAASTNGKVAAIVPQSDLDVPSMLQGTGHSGELKRDVVLMVRAPPEGAAT